MIVTAALAQRINRAPASVYSEACERRDWLLSTDRMDERDVTTEWFETLLLATAKRQFDQTVQPLVDQKVRVFVAYPTFSRLVQVNGALRYDSIEPELPEDVRAALALLDEMIESERQRYFGWWSDCKVSRETPQPPDKSS
jgi:hypothetical protein